MKYAYFIDYYNHGLKEQEVKKAMEICNMYKEEFIQEWHRRFD